MAVRECRAPRCYLYNVVMRDRDQQGLFHCANIMALELLYSIRNSRRNLDAHAGIYRIPLAWVF